MDLFNKYIQLIKTVREAGRFSLKELNGRWLETESLPGNTDPEVFEENGVSNWILNKFTEEAIIRK